MGNVWISDCHNGHDRPCKFRAIGSLCLLCVPVSTDVPLTLNSNVAPLLASPGAL